MFSIDSQLWLFTTSVRVSATPTQAEKAANNVVISATGVEAMAVAGVLVVAASPDVRALRKLWPSA